VIIWMTRAFCIREGSEWRGFKGKAPRANALILWKALHEPLSTVRQKIWGRLGDRCVPIGGMVTI
jgi:hypothetical protein